MYLLHKLRITVKIHTFLTFTLRKIYTVLRNLFKNTSAVKLINTISISARNVAQKDQLQMIINYTVKSRLRMTWIVSAYHQIICTP